jgi:phosphatidylinositol 3-kinase
MLAATAYNYAQVPHSTTLTNPLISAQVIYKTGDDLRQDQLVLQLILLFDRLLKHENLDLKFVPYNVLATSRYDGLLECVPESMNLATILSEYNGDIQKFLRKFNPDPKAPYGITPVALDNFIRSTGTFPSVCLALRQNRN